MWKRVIDTEFYLSVDQTSQGYNIYATNYVSLWSAFFSEKAFGALLRECNDGLELENDNEFIAKGLHLLSNPGQLKKATIVKEGDRTLFTSLKILFGYPFIFECRLTKAPTEMYFGKITLPLLKTVQDLRSSETKLRHLLIKKDKEIDEYKCEGGEIVLRHLKTVAFDDTEHMSNFSLFDENFGSTDIGTMIAETSAMMTQTNGIPEDPTQSIKQEENNVKQEFNIVLQEPNVLSQEPVVIKEEPNSIAEEPNVIKQEPGTTGAPQTYPLASSSTKTIIKAEKKEELSPKKKRLKKLNY